MTSRYGKFLALVLRHRPDLIGLTLDVGGWARIDHLLRSFKSAGRGLSRADLERIVAEDKKTRFSFSEDGRRIRANQGP